MFLSGVCHSYHTSPHFIFPYLTLSYSNSLYLTVPLFILLYLFPTLPYLALSQDTLVYQSSFPNRVCQFREFSQKKLIQEISQNNYHCWMIFLALIRCSTIYPYCKQLPIPAVGTLCVEQLTAELSAVLAQCPYWKVLRYICWRFRLRMLAVRTQQSIERFHLNQYRTRMLIRSTKQPMNHHR